ncbi:hypothetical protein D3C73_1211920 [compost metagenome]
MRVVFFEPHQFIQGVKAEGADAGDVLQLLWCHQAADIGHHGGGAWAFPADYRIKQFAIFINQRAVYAKRGDGNPADLAGRQFR